jgi:hypothetical protein
VTIVELESIIVELKWMIVELNSMIVELKSMIVDPSSMIVAPSPMIVDLEAAAYRASAILAAARVAIAMIVSCGFTPSAPGTVLPSTMYRPGTSCAW